MIAPHCSALVIGGSVGGLAAAHELRSIGAEVTVFERSVDRTQPRGAGIVIQPEVVGSTVRSLLNIPGAAAYSGYVAFRGLEPEAGLPSHLVELLAERFTMFAVPGLQLLCSWCLAPVASSSRAHVG